MLPLLLLSMLVMGFFSCEMAGNESTNVETGNYDENFADFGELQPGVNPENVSYINQYVARREVKDFLTDWFNEYYKTHTHNGNVMGYVDMGGTAQGHISTEEISTSEALGYGLRLANYYNQLGGGDYFNTLQRLRRTTELFTFGTDKHTGLQESYCNWYIPANFDREHVANDSDRGPATDGDFDIAYGLILGAMHFEEAALYAGNRGTTLRYRTEAEECEQLALDYIRGIARHYHGTAYVNGVQRNYINVAPHNWPEAIPLTRPSDWMPHHLEVFIKFYQENGPSSNKSFYVDRLQGMLDGTIEMIKDNQWGNGFVPDFIIFDRYYQDSLWHNPDGADWPEQKWHGSGPGTYRALTVNDPVWPDLGEDLVPSSYHWNACRFPWRVFEHYQLSNEGNYWDQYYMGEALRRIYRGLLPNRGMDSIGVQYGSNWNKIESRTSTAFSAPAALSVIAMPAQNASAGRYKGRIIRQNYEYLVNDFYGLEPAPGKDDCGYFADSINAFSLLLMSDLIEDPYPRLR